MSEVCRGKPSEGNFVFEPEHIVRCEGELKFPEVNKMRTEGKKCVLRMGGYHACKN